MKTLTKALNRFVLHSYDFIKNLAGAVMVAIVLIVTAGIFSRYVFDHALAWTEELCCLLLIWLCYLSASLTTVTKEHVVADFISGSLPAAIQKFLRIIIRGCEVIFFAVVAWSVIQIIPALTNVSAALEMPRYFYYLPVLVGSAYMCIVVMVDLLNDFVPGYDFFAQRKAERDKAQAEAERRDNEEMLKNVDDFFGVEHDYSEEEEI